MKFYISNFQMEPDYVFNHSYKVDSFISEKISKELGLNTKQYEVEEGEK